MAGVEPALYRAFVTRYPWSQEDEFPDLKSVVLASPLVPLLLRPHRRRFRGRRPRRARHRESGAPLLDRLLAAGRLTAAQADLWHRVIGFRNVIGHSHLDVDRAIVFDVLMNSLGDPRDLHRVFVDAQANP